LNRDWLIPDWPAPANVQAVFTTRVGGFSTAPWDSLNLGDHVGDAPADVAANRAALQQAIVSHPVFLKQVHGVGVEQLTSATPDGTVADACVTTERGLACTIMVADCLPVLLTNTDGSAVAAAHAGWRGLAGVDARGDLSEKGERMGVLESVFAAFQASNRPLDQSKRAQAAPEIVAWLGPCIGPAAFEVGVEVKAAFVASVVFHSV
jgi:copper oxidase (laccase) domain-containing protein